MNNTSKASKQCQARINDVEPTPLCLLKLNILYKKTNPYSIEHGKKQDDYGYATTVVDQLSIMKYHS